MGCVGVMVMGEWPRMNKHGGGGGGMLLKKFLLIYCLLFGILYSLILIFFDL